MKTSFTNVALLVLGGLLVASPGASISRAQQRHPFEKPAVLGSLNDRPTSRSFARRYSAVESRQMFSYEPLAIRAGDRVVVARDNARLMVGTQIVGTVAKGRTLDVVRVQGPWVGTNVEIDGKKVAGWIWFQHVSTPTAAPKTDSKS